MTKSSPLAGVTVLDLGQMYNGPYCGFLLAQAGARVIKIESPQGETLRRRAVGTSQIYPFTLLNAGKECISLNLKDPQGQEILKGLAMQADVLIENFAPGTMAGFGLGSESLLALNPRLIYAASTGYGEGGPNSDLLGMDITIQAMSGLMSITGQGDSGPLKSGAAVSDFLGGVHLYGAVMTALYRRERSGEGAVLDISMQDCMFPTLATAIGSFLMSGSQAPRTGNRHPGLSVAPYNVYRANDGFVAMICIRDDHWHRLCEAMQRPDLAADPRFTDMASRCENMDALDAEINAWSAGHSKREVFEITQAHGVISAPVQNLDDLVHDEHMHQRGSLFWSNIAGFGDSVMCRSPLRFKGVEAEVRGEVAELGAHTDAVLAEMLGMNAEDIASLREKAVC